LQLTTGVYIVSAPSGSGKTTLVERLLKEVPRLIFSISYTTRPPRGQEQDGREYFFITRAEFEAMIASEELLEWAEVFGNYYGTSRRFLEQARESGQDLLLDIDVQGAAQVKEKLPNSVSVFILPPSMAELKERLLRNFGSLKRVSEATVVELKPFVGQKQAEMIVEHFKERREAESSNENATPPE